MAARQRPLALFGLLLLLLAPSSEAAVSRADCAELGFTETLVCSKCDRLSKAVGEAGGQLVQECSECCSEDHAEDRVLAKAHSAEVEICQ
uniref:Selenoprotein F/M domain-containing protein n=1 Tax=Hemiselmis andersenii TaxID=464988 RepID=A0A6U4IGA5_HEMAN